MVFVLINVKNVLAQKHNVLYVLKVREDFKLMIAVIVWIHTMMMVFILIVKNVLVNVKHVHLLMNVILVMPII